MKKLAVLAILSLMSTSAFALMPRSIDRVWYGEDFLVVTDKQDFEWMIKQECKRDIEFTSSSNVKVTATRSRIRQNTNMVVDIDGQRNVCRVTKVLLLSDKD